MQNGMDEYLNRGLDCGILGAARAYKADRVIFRISAKRFRDVDEVLGGAVAPPECGLDLRQEIAMAAINGPSVDRATLIASRLIRGLDGGYNRPDLRLCRLYRSARKTQSCTAGPT